MINSEEDHTPVLKNETIALLKVKKNNKYIDATVGMGGHAIAIVELGGKVLGIDKDAESLGILIAKCNRLNIKGLKCARASFKHITKIAKKHNFTKPDGIIFDLGISSWQLNKSGRGITHMRDEPLDMRLDTESETTAKDLINGSTSNELYEIISRYSEEKYSGRISKAIISSRPLNTTGQLKKAIENSLGNDNRKHKAVSRVFQAIRIAVNNELSEIAEALTQSIEILKPGGRIAVISFHSLEDRIVKKKFKELNESKMGIIVTKKPVRPNRAEIRANPRSKSAKLRAFEKCS